MNVDMFISSEDNPIIIMIQLSSEREKEIFSILMEIRLFECQRYQSELWQITEEEEEEEANDVGICNQIFVF